MAQFPEGMSGDAGWIACWHRVLRDLVSIVDGEYDNIKCNDELPLNERVAKIGGPPHQKEIRMRIHVKFYYCLLCIIPFSVAISMVAAQQVDTPPPSSAQSGLPKVGNVCVADVLKRLGAKLEQRTAAKELDAYSGHFERTDPNRDGKHTRKEYIEKGRYLTPQARAGIFRAADGNADGIVTRAEYVLNRIITDEAKAIVQGMDDDKDGLVERAEFVKHATKLLADPKLAEQVFTELDTNADGRIPIPEYLQIWGRWARVGRKSAEDRIAARQAAIADSLDKTDKKEPGSRNTPPSVDEIFKRFDGDKDGKLREEEIPRFARQFILPADGDGDDVVTKAELQAARQRARTSGKGRPAAESHRRPAKKPQ